MAQDHSEFIKYYGDKWWRINHLYKIKDRNKKLITFKCNQAQTHYVEHKAHRNIILKSRRLGFTTYEAIDTLDEVLWNPNYDALMLSYDKESALEMFDEKIVLAWDHYPDMAKKLVGVDTDRANKLKFIHEGKKTSSIQVRNRGRSGTYFKVHISELGKIAKESRAKAKEIISGLIPTITADGFVDIESTAEGDDGIFHDMFWEAWNRGEPTTNLEYKAHFYNWRWDLEEINKVDVLEVPQDFTTYKNKYDLTDKEISYYYQKWLSLNKSWNTLFQEYPTTPEEAFVFSGTRLFDAIKLEWQKQWEKDGEKIGDWIYFEDYNTSHYYGLGADVAEGVGQDSSTITIIDFTTSKVVARYRSNLIPPDTFAHVIKKGAEKYGECIAGVERNNHGFTTLNVLKGIYWNIYTEEKKDKATDKVTEKLGWLTTGSTKPLMLFELNDAMNEQTLIIPSKEIVQELRTYDQTDLSQIKFNDDQTKHWDLVISTAICWQMRTLVGLGKYKKETRDNEDNYNPHDIL